MTRGSNLTPVEPRPAASVMVFRSAPGGPLVLYLQRNPDLKFHGGYWVFPGGRVDPGDHAEGGDEDEHEEMAAKRAAVREAQEEAGIDLPLSGLAYAIHWTTPEVSPIRFSTWFFIAEATSWDVQVDGEEIHDHRWMRPNDALEAHAAGAIKLAAPTFALTTRLADWPDVESVFAAVGSWPQERLLGCLHDVPGGLVAVYEQDVAYDRDVRALEESGPRHRLWMVDSGWRYERDF